MKILLFLLSFFISEYKGGVLLPVWKEFEDNGYDFKKTLRSLTPEKISPVIATILGVEQKENPPKNGGQPDGLDAIMNVADVTVYSCLYDYFNNH